ncbi:MAG: glycosyltransferase family 2 protein [Flavobacteriaceae bacterium]
MLSILIPIYNYNVTSLIETLQTQIEKVDIDVEIICCDDASTDQQLQAINYQFLTTHNLTYLKNATNIGRTKTRQLLSDSAQFNWLLFLDADVIPVLPTFLATYISFLSEKQECVYGGLSYSSKPPEKTYYFRWLYGHQREDIPLNKRKLTPYKSIASGNLLIKKGLFTSINKSILHNWYGYDNFFSAQLKATNSSIKHINNKVYHLGLEDNSSFLKKQELATETIYELYKGKYFTSSHDNGLLKTYYKLKKYKLIWAYNCFYSIFKNRLKNNLLQSKPKLYYLDLYRLGYFCRLTQ